MAHRHAVNDNSHPPHLYSSPNNSTMNVQGAKISDETIESNEGRGIVLPNQTDHVSQISVDIGGSLAKLVYFTTNPSTPGGRLNFCFFETEKIDQCIEFIATLLEDARKKNPSLREWVIKATGGGAHKYHDRMERKLPGVIIQKEDEMECLITGLDFLLIEIPYEAFTYSESDPMCFDETLTEIYPYMLVNIGSGVSILKVTGPGQYERISGTSLGGGTLWGLLSLLTNAKTFDEMLQLSQKGNNHNVDMLVGDIYGMDYNKIGLKSTAIASSFGKVFKKNIRREQGSFKPEDVSRSLLYSVSNNIGQIAYLNARIHNLNRIYFGGTFIRGHPITMNTLSYAINFWSKGTMKALFLRHEGYLGAVGAFLKHQPILKTRHSFSFLENFTINQKFSDVSLNAYGIIERTPNKLDPFPLLEELASYHPDTFELRDAGSQQYWIGVLEKSLDELVEVAIEWQDGDAASDENGNSKDVRTRLKSFAGLFRSHLTRLREEPNVYGVLTMRSLLNLREQCLHELGFPDIFAKIKKVENKAALKLLPDILRQVDAIHDPKAQIEELIINALAGNMFDWGSISVLRMLRVGTLDFETAKEKVRLQNSPFNQTDNLIQRLVDGPPFHKAVIFVDNSGADIILGMVPLAKFLLKRGTKVLMAANTFPAVNDVTATELTNIIRSVSDMDEIIARAWDENKLEVMGTGSSSPCLDLRKISSDLAEACQDVDFVVLEGMGRAIHTNFWARFKCDSLKIAVFKSPMLASQLGAQMYDGMVIFQPGNLNPVS